MTQVNRQWVLRQRPRGPVKAGDLELVESPVPDLKENEVLVRTIYLSLDPTNRTWMNDAEGYLPAVGLGDVMRGLTLGVVEQSRSRTDQSVLQAEEADAALTSITQAVSVINDMNNQIASAAEEQSAVAEDINRNVMTIDTVAKSVAKGADEASEASASLTKLAEHQRRLINQFKV